MTDPVEPSELSRIADAIQTLAFQMETANLLAYNEQPNTRVRQAIAQRLDVERLLGIEVTP